MHLHVEGKLSEEQAQHIKGFLNSVNYIIDIGFMEHAFARKNSYLSYPAQKDAWVNEI